MKIEKISLVEVVKRIGSCFGLFLCGDIISGLLIDLANGIWKVPTGINLVIRPLANLVLVLELWKLYIRSMLKSSYKKLGFNFAVNLWGILVALGLLLYVVIAYLIIGVPHVNQQSLKAITVHILSSVIMAMKCGICEELLFRGFIMRTIEARWGRRSAIVAPSVFFAILHLPSMGEFEAASILLTLLAGTLVGVMFSEIAYQGSSLGNGMVIHGIWNLAFVTDILHITTMNETNRLPLISIIIPKENILLSGGAFGVESSIISILGYVGVSVFVIYLSRSKKENTVSFC